MQSFLHALYCLYANLSRLKFRWSSQSNAVQNVWQKKTEFTYWLGFLLAYLCKNVRQVFSRRYQGDISGQRSCGQIIKWRSESATGKRQTNSIIITELTVGKSVLPRYQSLLKHCKLRTKFKASVRIRTALLLWHVLCKYVISSRVEERPRERGFLHRSIWWNCARLPAWYPGANSLNSISTDENSMKRWCFKIFSPIFLSVRERSPPNKKGHHSRKLGELSIRPNTHVWNAEYPMWRMELVGR